MQLPKVTLHGMQDRQFLPIPLFEVFKNAPWDHQAEGARWEMVFCLLDTWSGAQVTDGGGI